MATVTMDMVKQLREATGAGIKNVKDALVAANGDMDAAAKALREKGLAKAAKRVDREANEGVIKTYLHELGKPVGVMVEVNCETDFVARNEAFQQLAHNIALQIAAMSPEYVSVNDVPEEIVASEREILRKQALAEGKPEKIVDRMVEGRVKKFYKDNVLLEQAFVKDESKTISDLVQDAIAKLGENIVVRRFSRYALGA